MGDYNDSNYASLFNHNAAEMLMAFANTYNIATQAVAFAAADPATTGTAMCYIDGVLIPSLTVEDDADWSSDTSTISVEGDAEGFVVPDTYSQYLAVFADADGRLRIDLAGDLALDADVECKIPMFDPSTYVCIAIVLIDGNGCTLGTTNINALATVYQVVGPVYPHPDNLPQGI